MQIESDAERIARLRMINDAALASRKSGETDLAAINAILATIRRNPNARKRNHRHSVSHRAYR